jgi:hypothetical protein
MTTPWPRRRRGIAPSDGARPGEAAAQCLLPWALEHHAGTCPAPSPPQEASHGRRPVWPGLAHPAPAPPHACAAHGSPARAPRDAARLASCAGAQLTRPSLERWRDRAAMAGLERGLSTPPSPLGPARCPSQAPPRGPGPAGGPGGSSGAPPPSPAPAGRPGQRRGDAPELRRGDRPPDVGHAVRRRPAPDGCPPPHSPPGAAREGRLGARPPRLAGLSRPRLPRRGWPARGQPAAVRRRSQPPKPAWRAIPPWPAAIIPRPRPYAGAWFMVARVNCRAGGAPSPLVLPTLSVVADPRRGGRRGVPVARRAWPRPGPWMRWSGRIAAGS